jgi:hypothetical protein
METRSRLSASIDHLIALFNRRSEDVPDGLFDRRTQFVLNDVPFEAMLGRPATDPLVLMLTRGAAGYRFTAKALVHAIPDATIERGEIATTTAGGVETAQWQCWLSGHLRGTEEPIDAMFDVELSLNGIGGVARACVTINESRLSAIREARRRA